MLFGAHNVPEHLCDGTDYLRALKQMFAFTVFTDRLPSKNMSMPNKLYRVYEYSSVMHYRATL